MIELKNVTKTYRQGHQAVVALKGVNLTIPDDQFWVLMGTSGSGKSTLLNLVGCLDFPTSGEVLLEGRSTSRLSDEDLSLLRRRRIGFVFQFFNLLPTLTARENIALPMLLDGRTMEAARPKVEALLEAVGLAQRAEHRPDELSGGEMQRVAIARALINDPLVLLADEPTGNLDSRTGGDILELLRRITKERGGTLLLATHDQRAAELADRTIFIQDGEVV
ncbi:MAG: ABC transporter ATP-binding protein [Candidatus Tectomicrobia bacterium]|nr:ABC transporter ATP-binding protein [Candidatus Tectomicrobia bacterium]